VNKCGQCASIMASEFIGHLILVTLASPPKAQVQGVVADVANSRLFLRDGALPSLSSQRTHHADMNSDALVESTTPSCLHHRVGQHPRPRSLSSNTGRIHKSIWDSIRCSVESSEHRAAYPRTTLSRSCNSELQQTSSTSTSLCASTSRDSITDHDS
jgi:hypothetical protein